MFPFYNPVATLTWMKHKRPIQCAPNHESLELVMGLALKRRVRAEAFTSGPGHDPLLPRVFQRISLVWAWDGCTKSGTQYSNAALDSFLILEQSDWVNTSFIQVRSVYRPGYGRETFPDTFFMGSALALLIYAGQNFLCLRKIVSFSLTSSKKNTIFYK